MQTFHSEIWKNEMIPNFLKTLKISKFDLAHTNPIVWTQK